MMFKIKTVVKYIEKPTLYPMGPVTFAIACSHCQNLGSELCRSCKMELQSGFQLKVHHEKEG